MDNITSRIKVVATQIEAIEKVLQDFNESDWNKVESKNLPEIQQNLKAYTFQELKEKEKQLRELQILLLRNSQVVTPGIY